MRTSSILSYSALLASSGTLALAFSFAAPEQFDNSLLRARSGLPNVVAMDSSMLVKRAEGQWDCNDDEEYVAYDDDDDDEEDDNNEQQQQDNKSDDVPVFEPATQPAQVKAVKQQEAPSTTPPAPAQPQSTGYSNSKPAPVAAPVSSSVTTPNNIAEGTYTADEGCARYYEIKAGDICLKLVEENQDLGLTLDQLYCLNPAIDDLCFNLWIGTSYCVGYSGEEPLNTGVSSQK